MADTDRMILDGVELIDLTVHAATGETLKVHVQPPRVVEFARRFLRDGYWEGERGVSTLHAVTRVDVHAGGEELRATKEIAQGR